MTSSQFVVSPVQSRNVSIKWTAVLVAAGLIVGAIVAVLLAQNLTARSAAGSIEMVVPDKRLVYPTGSSWHRSPSLDGPITPQVDNRTVFPNGSWWHQSPTIDNRTVFPNGSSWHQSPSIDNRTVYPNGSSWHQSPSITGSAADARLTNAYGTSWFYSGGEIQADAE